MTQSQRKYAQSIIQELRESDDPRIFFCESGAVKPMRDGRFCFKPRREYRCYDQFNIRIVFRVQPPNLHVDAVGARSNVYTIIDLIAEVEMA